MNPQAFLADQKGPRTWRLPSGIGGFTPVYCFLGEGRNPLEVAVATAGTTPSEGKVRALWRARHGNTPSPLLLVVLYPDGGLMRAAVCGPAGSDPAVRTGLEAAQVERLAQVALGEPDRHAAIRFLTDSLAHTETNLPGLRNVGMFATHELREGVPRRNDWPRYVEAGRPLLAKRGRELVEALGFEVESRGVATQVLRVREGHRRVAVAVFLERGEQADAPSARFQDKSPVSYALARADQESLDFVVLTQGPAIRVYSVHKHAGVGRRGPADTFIEANLALLPDHAAGYLPLLFSAAALAEGGSFEEMLRHSRDFAAALGERLRDRVYDEVVPRLAQTIGRSVAKSRRRALSEADLPHVQEMAMRVLFRLLFISYGEDKGLLPYEMSGEYRRHALKTRARTFAERLNEGRLTFDEHATDLWSDVLHLFDAIDHGNTDWGVPQYNGGLFASEEERSQIGADIARLSLTNAEFGPALAALLVDRSPADRVYGPVDFRALSVREFGTIYEGLLESSLALAATDLVLGAEDRYVPAERDEVPVVTRGSVYLRNESGARKVGGSYFTKQFAVERLLERALNPALDAHLAHMKHMIEAGSPADAARAFFTFRCADLAMGSGHFLVAAIDHIEARMTRFLAENPLPNVQAELERLRASARAALGDLGDGMEIETSSLLRRQIARRCVYGIDLNEIAVELARVAVWIHTFVPGLPLSFLNHNLVHGNSLTGIANEEEALHLLDPDVAEGGVSLWSEPIERWMGEARQALDRLGRILDATAAEVASAYSAHREAEERVRPAQDLFDLLVALRLGEVGVPDVTRDGFASQRDRKRAAALAEQFLPVHFPLRFPEVFSGETPGFHCIVGNPPWDKVMFEPQQFWVMRDPGLNALDVAARERRIEELRDERPDAAAAETALRANREREQEYFKAAYALQSRGHLEYAKLFTERALALLAPQGTLGYVLPRQSLVLGGWDRLRAALLDDSTLDVTQARNAGGWVFDDVHHSYMVVLLARLPSTSPRVVIHGAVRSPEQFHVAGCSPLSVSRSELETFSDSLVIPWFDGTTDEQLFSRMKDRPRLASGDGWITGLHDARWDFRSTGPHARLARRRPGKGLWGVFMTRHVDAWQIRTSAALQQYVDPIDLATLDRGVHVRRGVAMLGSDHPVIAVRHPSRNDDRRTLIACAIPHAGYIHNKGYIHAIAHPPGTSAGDILALLAFVNSFVCDWWVRRIVDRHVTAPVINNLPVPDWTDGQRSEAAVIASELLLRGGIDRIAGGTRLEHEAAFADRPEEELLARIEWLAAAGFGLDRPLMEAVLADFSERAAPAALRQRILEQWA